MLQGKVKASYATGEEASRSFRLAFSVATRLAKADEWDKGGQESSSYEIDKLVKQVENIQSVKNSIAMLSLRQGGHRLVKTDRGHRCEKCFKHRITSNFKGWLTHRCQPKASGKMIISRKRKLREQASQASKRSELEDPKEDQDPATAAAMPPVSPRSKSEEKGPTDPVTAPERNQPDNPEGDSFESEPERLGQHASASVTSLTGR